MSQAPTTRPSLLVRLRDTHDAEAWRQFVRLYAPLVYRYARRNGLQDADAADLTQDVLRAVSTGAIRMEYDPQRGSFRGWLFTIAQRKLCNLLAQQRRPGRGSGDGGVQVLLDEQPDRDEADRWEEEYRRRVFAWAAECVRPTVSDTTWQAFWQTAVEGRSGAEVAAELTMTVAAVYLAKSRVMVRLKEQVQQWEQSPEQ
jgi:RNA polymerase sigma factor (sigma-70 family)